MRTLLSIRRPRIKAMRRWGWLIRISAQFKICDLCNRPRDRNVNAFISSHSCPDIHPLGWRCLDRMACKSVLNHLWMPKKLLIQSHTKKTKRLPINCWYCFDSHVELLSFFFFSSGQGEVEQRSHPSNDNQWFLANSDVAISIGVDPFGGEGVLGRKDARTISFTTLLQPIPGTICSTDGHKTERQNKLDKCASCLFY